MEFVANESDWVKYADVVGDKNPIHRDNDIARSFGLEGVIAPGMWVVSHVQGDSRIQKAEFKFKVSVYGGDVILPKGDSFYRGDKLVCKGDVVLGDPTGENVALPSDIVYSKNFSASGKNVSDFWRSIGVENYRDDSEMYLMALSAPVMLGYADKKGLIGSHLSQSVEIYRPFDLGDTTVHVQEDNLSANRCKLNLYWESKGEVVAGGKSKALMKPI